MSCPNCKKCEEYVSKLYDMILKLDERVDREVEQNRKLELRYLALTDENQRLKDKLASTKEGGPMTEPDFRPCPGCESTTQIHLVPCIIYYSLKAFSMQYKVKCFYCEAHTKLYDTEAEAISAWNLEPEEENGE